MPSPFPGMNPYLERSYLWENFHNRFIIALSDELSSRIRPKYFVGLEHSIYIHEMPDDRYLRFGKPDLAILPGRPSFEPATRTATLEAPARLVIPFPVEELRIPFLQILDVQRNRVVTTVEVLSPSNKTGPDRELYLNKRHRYLKSEANFVEIDLLRGGERMPVDGLPACGSCIVVSRPPMRPHVDVWPVLLRDALPLLPIPLGPDDAEPTVDLQRLLHQVYDAGAFDLKVYNEPPEPTLSAEDLAWAESLVPA